MYSEPISHLPDPQRQSEFYDSVTVKRGIAWVLDTVIIAAFTLVVSFFFAITIIGILFIPLLTFAIGFVYRWWTIGSGSATWGMRTMSIELRDAYGRRLTNGQAFWHTIGFTLSVIIFPLQIVSVIMMFVSERGQGLTDHFLGTVALNRRH